jgi:hypothetical protein
MLLGCDHTYVLILSHQFSSTICICTLHIYNGHSLAAQPRHNSAICITMAWIFLLQLFKEDPETGLTHMALSSDSTCVNHLYSSQDGYETLHLEKIEQPQEPQQDIMVSSARCEFPAWMKGDWEGLSIGDNGAFTYRDEDNFVTYKGHCVTEMPPAEENLDGLEGQRYLLFLQTECGTTTYSCALFQRRDSNVLEFQLGM